MIARIQQEGTRMTRIKAGMKKIKQKEIRCYAADGLCTLLQARKLGLTRGFYDQDLNKPVHKTHQLRNT